MSKLYGCPKCGHTRFEAEVKTFDAVIFGAKIMEFAGSPSLETLEFVKDYCGDTETSPNVECCGCGHTFDYKEGVPQNDTKSA
jgi:rubredoxin